MERLPVLREPFKVREGMASAQVPHQRGRTQRVRPVQKMTLIPLPESTAVSFVARKGALLVALGVAETLLPKTRGVSVITVGGSWTTGAE
jgi:hypothetical protein